MSMDVAEGKLRRLRKVHHVEGENQTGDATKKVRSNGMINDGKGDFESVWLIISLHLFVLLHCPFYTTGPVLSFIL